MRCFTDTSFLCALYREQDNTERADALMKQDQVEIINRWLGGEIPHPIARRD